MSWFARKGQFASWDEFWAAFRSLCEHCESLHQSILVAELKDAQGYVNGLTDGWHDFKTALQQVESHHRYELDEQSQALFTQLLHALASVNVRS